MKTIKSIYLIVFLLVTGAVFAENKEYMHYRMQL